MWVSHVSKTSLGRLSHCFSQARYQGVVSEMDQPGLEKELWGEDAAVTCGDVTSP